MKDFPRALKRAGLIPAGEQVHFKGRRGSISVDSPVLEALKERHHSVYRVDAVGFTVWWDGEPVLMRGIRSILRKLCERPSAERRRLARRYETVLEAAEAIAEKATAPPAVDRFARSPSVRAIRGAVGAELVRPTIAELMFLILGQTVTPLGINRLTQLLTSDPATTRGAIRVVTRAGILPLEALADTFDELTDDQLLRARDQAHAMVEDLPALISGIEAVASDVVKLPVIVRQLKTASTFQFDWQSRALLVVLLAALRSALPIADAQELDAIFRALKDNAAPVRRWLVLWEEGEPETRARMGESLLDGFRRGLPDWLG